MKVLPFPLTLSALALSALGLRPLSLNPLNPGAIRRLSGLHDLRAPATLVRATALELAILAGHVLLYPTGLTAERPTGRERAPRAREPQPEETDAAAGPSAGSTTGLPSAGAADHPPVVMLHGFVDNRSVFVLLRRSLARHGWRDLECLNYSPLTCDVRTAAELLGRHIAQVCARTGRNEVDIVGHSLGGLIARYYIQCLGGDLRVRTLVTLGTPHSGTTAAPLASAHPVVRQMRPGSALIEELRGPAPGCRTRFVSFWSDLDQWMVPIETARLDHPDLITENVQVSSIGHLALPVHPAVAAGIRQALEKNESTGTPGAVSVA
ncbi:esterase/lipase family protein [Streptomyces sp. NPDC001889]